MDDDLEALLPAELIRGLLGFPKGRKLKCFRLPEPFGAPQCVGATHR